MLFNLLHFNHSQQAFIGYRCPQEMTTGVMATDQQKRKYLHVMGLFAQKQKQNYIF